MPSLVTSFFSQLLGSSFKENMRIRLGDDKDGKSSNRTTENGKKPEILSLATF